MLLHPRFIFCLTLAGFATIAATASSFAADDKTEVWTDADDPSLPKDFAIQGEYLGEIEGGQTLGAQVISLAGGAFQAVVYPDGLPGAGWGGEEKILMDGRLEGEKAVFEPASGDKSYLADPPEKFSATKDFPPQGHKPYTAVIDGEVMEGETDDGKPFRLKQAVRASQTMSKKPPSGAVVLFDGTKESMKNWQGGRLDEQTGLLNTDGKDILTKDNFNNYTMHLEFLLPYRPGARGQGRGNSGFYQVDHYEVQILDSFGLEGLNNECGGVYTKADPSVNMCFPPLAWQTYDADFTNAVRDDSGEKIKNARLTLRHNGVVVHDDIEIDGPTGGHRSDPEGTPGPIKLQGHGNPLQFRNIWIAPR
ncbi:MAG: DUF1080 domain-containing protein [Planctomycetes bacterium]|nr:DUF1080 domain-containing protein [Planctomycetota bacterium]